jgi:hypothetical protein
MKALATLTVGLLVCVSVLAAPTATLTLTSPQHGATVASGATISYTISVLVSSGDNVGLALVSVDLEQAAGNPELFDIPPATDIPSNMAKFRRPLGISNPDENSLPGYAGVQRGTSPGKNLRQIGGAQNTFGAPGGTIGTDPNPVSGVGQGTARQVTSGSFLAPTTEGVYTFELKNALVNVMTAANAPPAFSPVVSVATSDINLTGGVLTFTVSNAPAFCIGDVDCSGEVDFFDIDPFVAKLGCPSSDPVGCSAGCPWQNADADEDGDVDFFDIDPFVATLGNTCP